MSVARVGVKLIVRGAVQGVGFRPFVHRLARELGVAGSVRNEGGAVVVEASGAAEVVALFARRLREDAPPGAAITHVAEEGIPSDAGDAFEIRASVEAATLGAFPAADRATCEACVREHDDPTHRMFGYAFITCTACGPRLSILEGVPYDRERTSMREFRMCDACAADHADVEGRRHHAVGIACPACGPRLSFDERDVARSDGEAGVIAHAAARLRAGAIGAIKGLGGYQLACDATDEAVVLRLRSRKSRPDKPMALMVSDEAMLETFADATPEEWVELRSAARPIVLLRSRGGGIADAVSGRSPVVGVMLPTTALHLALLRAVGRPLVMTSGNASEEPMAIDERTACLRLSNIADFFLHHDRRIVTRIDDSVTRVVPSPLVLRRARGLAPSPIRLPRAFREPTLALGAELKSTFALGIGEEAIVSPHIGDLDSVETYAELERAVRHFEKILAVSPRVVVHDLHPDMLSTRYALEHASELGARTVAVQHHHAHVGACAIDAEWDGPLIGVVFDGMGLGTDGAAWGGEVFTGEIASLQRFAHLRYVPMPGGDIAAREGLRMAVAHLADAGVPLDVLEPMMPRTELVQIARLCRSAALSPPTSSVGRLFDAVAAAARVRGRSSYEGQAACELEWTAEGSQVKRAYPFELARENGSLVVDTRPLVRGVASDIEKGVAASEVARCFHNTLAEVVAATCELARSTTGIRHVALSGGCFANALLSESCRAKLVDRGFEVLMHRRLPPNDGAICLGQLAISAAREVETLSQ